MGESHKLNTRSEARESLRRRGETVRGWAEKHGISEKVVFNLLSGRLKGNYGDAHKAAVLLGIKDGVLDD